MGPLLLAGVLFVVYGGGYVGLDAMWSIVWGRDIVHAAPLAVSQTTTPHVLSNLLGAVLTPLGSDADHGLVAVAFLAAGGLVWVSGLLARQIAGTTVGVCAGLLVAVRESLLFATTSAFLDVFVALFVLWAALLVVRRGVDRPGAAGALLLLAGLLRPEPWVLAAALWVWRWRRGHGFGPAQLLSVVAAPAAWLAVDAAFSGDALFSIHTTQRIGALIRAGDHISDSLAHRVIDAPKNIAHATGVELFVLAVLAAAVLLWPRAARLPGLRLAVPAPERREPLLVLLWGALLYSAVIVVEALDGGLIYTRFALPVMAVVVVTITVLAATVAGAARDAGRTPAGRWILPGTVAVLLVIQLPLMISARTTTSHEHDRYDAARAALRDVVRCLPAVTPNTNFRAYVAAWNDLRGDEVIDGASHPVPPLGTYVTATTPQASLMLRDAVFPQRAMLPPAPVVRASGGWLVTSRCPAR
ncbi:MAG: hypothetical protein AAGC46_01050 [Solirubrobacteraceae bacterium]|nr:hypothetical protein [Patulibacter sp.]